MSPGSGTLRTKKLNQKSLKMEGWNGKFCNWVIMSIKESLLLFPSGIRACVFCCGKKQHLMVVFQRKQTNL